VIGLPDVFDVVLHHQASADYFELIDMRRPFGGRGCTGGAVSWEQDWYSGSGSVKHQEEISTFSIGALMVAEKLDLTRVVSSILHSPLNVLVPV
jgi:hypothetical protein